MSKVRYTVRLYRLHDLDLITFALSHELNVISAIYTSLTAFAKGESFVIQIPPKTHQRLPQLKRLYIKALTLDSEKDKEAIELLALIAPGYRNSFLKNLLRMYLCNPLSEEFFRVVKKAKGSDDVLYETPQAEIDEKNELFVEKFNIFKNGKKSVKAGIMRKGRVKKEEINVTVNDDVKEDTGNESVEDVVHNIEQLIPKDKFDEYLLGSPTDDKSEEDKHMSTQLTDGRMEEERKEEGTADDAYDEYALPPLTDDRSEEEGKEEETFEETITGTQQGTTPTASDAAWLTETFTTVM